MFSVSSRPLSVTELSQLPIVPLNTDGFSGSDSFSVGALSAIDSFSAGALSAIDSFSASISSAVCVALSIVASMDS